MTFAAFCLGLLPYVANAQSEMARTHTIPLFPSASADRIEGLARIINRSPNAGEVAIDAFDDAGRRHGPLTLTIGAHETAHFTSDDLESGNPDTTLTGSTGSGQGDWRLQLTSDLDIEALCYIRDADGFLTTMNAVAPVDDGTHRVATLNPGYNTNQVGKLRLANPTDGDAQATVHGVDGAGDPGGMPIVDIPAGGARTFASEQLEPGTEDGVRGALGSANSKWRLTVESERELVVMSVVSTPTGHLTNFSAAPSNDRQGVHAVRLLPPASNALGRQGFVRVINRSEEATEVSVAAFDDSEWEYEPVVLTVGANAAAHFNTNDLEQGNGSKGLSAGVGAGEGDWRLELSAPDIEVLSYLRTRTGFVTAMDGVAVQPDDGSHRYYLPLFHPADHPGQESRLRLTNTGDGKADITIRAMDDRGEGAPEGSVGLALQAGATLTLTAGQLERGAEGLSGRLGDGSGSWQLWVHADMPLEVMGLGHADNGLYENLSRGRAGYRAWPLTPDLEVASFSVSDGSPLAGESLTLSATVNNRGDGASDGTTLRYYRSTDAVVTTADTEVGTSAVPGLAASGGMDGSATLAAPSDAGTYHFGACVDSVPRESDVANNCSSSVEVTVRQPSPDLVVDGPSASDGTPEPGAAFTFSATVRNAGSGSSSATTLRYYRSANATISTGDTEVGTDQVDGLAASASSDQTITLTAPSDPGTHYYGACAAAVQGETDTTNNCSSAVAVTVRDTTATGPDLVIASVSVDEERPGPGGPVELSATVGNAGGAASTTTTLRYYRSDDTTISAADTELGTGTVSALPAAGTSDQSIMLNAPANVGTYYYGACVDGVAGETDTANNCSTALTVTVTEPARPDLVVGSPSVTDDTPEDGKAFTLSATVRNQGDSASGATTLRYYRSADATISTGDTELGTDAIAGLAASGVSGQQVELTAPTVAGTYYYGACVDAVADESATTNNCSPSVEVTVAEPTFADLVVLSPSVTEDSPDASEEFTFSATVKNEGDRDAALTTLRYFQSTDSTISTSDTEVGTDPVAALSASATSDQSIALTAPSDAGTYYYGACVDAVDRESDTTNNCSSGLELIVTDGPDLEVGSPSVDDQEPEPGATFTFSATVLNRGDEAADATTLRYYRSTDASISTSDTEVGTDDVAALAASESGDESVGLTPPSDPGTYYYGACVDAVAGESDTTNNCSSSVEVTVMEPTFPDLVVASASASESNPEPGAAFTLSATVSNQGDAEAADTTLRYFQSTDSTISTSDTEVGTDDVGVLAAPGTSDQSIALTAPASHGTYYYGACVDAVTGESDTTNNCSSSVEVTVPMTSEAPDLVVESPSVSNNQPDPRQWFTLSATVRNRGQEGASSTSLRYYLSTDATISTSDRRVGTDAVGMLAASGTSAQSIVLRALAPSAEGTYYYGACVDPVAGESDTTNNCSSAVEVTVPGPSSGPDLFIPTIVLFIEAPMIGAGDPVEVTIYVANAGEGASPASTLRYYRSDDATISTTDTEVGMDAVAALDPDAQVTLSIDFRAPAAGIYYYGGCVDTVSGETYTSNNCSGNVELRVEAP